MAKFLLRKNIKRICVLLCLIVVLCPVCRAQVIEPETQQPTISRGAELIEKKKPPKFMSTFWLDQPWEGNPLHPTNGIYRYEGLAVFKDWLDIETFVSPEMLSDRFGDFDKFYFYAETEALSDYPYLTVKEFYTDAYVYVFETDSDGKYNISLHIEKLQPDGMVRHLPETTESIAKDKIDPEDLRKADKPGTYWVGNIGYTYVYEKEYDEPYSNLTYFQWQSDGYAFLVDIDEAAVEQYTLDDGGFMAQLLRQETAPKAIEQFAKDLFPSQYPDESPDHSDENNKKWMLWIVPSAIVFFGIAATAFMLLRRKGKKNTAVMVTPPEETQLEKET